MTANTRRSEDRKSTSPGSTAEGRSLSRNAQAQARLRARRKAHVESLEAEIKRLQCIIDATALNPGRNSRPTTATTNQSLLGVFSSPVQLSSPNSDFGEGSRPPDAVQRLQIDNDRLRRERDAFEVQVKALMGYISRGCALLPAHSSPVSMNGVAGDDGTTPAMHETEQVHSPTLGSDADSEGRRSHSCDPFPPSPLIQPGTYTTDEINHMVSLYGSNLALLSHLGLHTQEDSLYSIRDKPIQLPALPGLSLFETT